MYLIKVVNSIIKVCRITGKLKKKIQASHFLPHSLTQHDILSLSQFSISSEVKEMSKC